MPPVRDLRDLRRRLRDFVERDRSQRATILNSIIRQHFLSFQAVGIVGGMVRDFARCGALHFRSDVDLVIAAPSSEVTKLARKLGAISNRFGGYGWADAGWKIDFWALETTWAAKEGYVKIEGLDDVPRCVFFDWDAVVYDLTSRRLICAPDYLLKIEKRQMDLVLPFTPSLEGNLLRALRRIALWQVAAGPGLLAFIEANLTPSRFSNMAITERRLYARRVTQEYPTLEAIRERVSFVTNYPQSRAGHQQLEFDFHI